MNVLGILWRKKKKQQRPSSSKQANERPKVRGRGSKPTFLRNDSQNKITEIIGTAMNKISLLIGDCIAWALMADTTPDVSRQEQLSIGVRIVHSDRTCSENILNCQPAGQKLKNYMMS